MADVDPPAWPRAWPPPARRASEVQLWLVPLTLDAEPPQDWLGAEELARAARFVFLADRCRYVGARRAVRALVGLALDLPPSAVPIALEPRGKPFLAGGPGFSLAHAGDLALVAIADGAVGVDLEPIRALPELPGMAAIVLGPTELAALAALDGDAATRAFFRAWTRKEALLKARGDGFLAEPRGVEVGVGPGAHRVVAVEGRSWHVLDLRPAPDVLAALAVPLEAGAEAPRVRTFTLPPGALERPLRLS